MRGTARAISSSVMSNGSVIRLPQLAMAEPKQLTLTPAASSASQAASKASSGMSWMFAPSMLRLSMLAHPSSLVARIWPARSAAASSANPVRYMDCSRKVVGNRS